jgi:hypothetical protein
MYLIITTLKYNITIINKGVQNSDNNNWNFWKYILHFNKAIIKKILLLDNNVKANSTEEIIRKM